MCFGNSSLIFTKRKRKSDTRQLIPLRRIELSSQGFMHLLATTVSSFLDKGKKTCWTKILQREKFAERFQKLRAEIVLKEEIFAVLEEFVYIIPKK